MTKAQGLCRTICLLTLLVFSASARADDPVHILATDWGLTLRSDGSGFYNDLARFVLPPSLGAINYEVLPYKRAKRLFISSKSACLFPNDLGFMAASGTISDPENYISARPIIATQTRVFSRLGTPPPEGVADLSGKTITYPLGSDVINLLRNTQALFIAVPDEYDKAKMLIEGRADLLIADLPDVKFVFDTIGVPMQAYAESFNVNGAETGIVCHRTAQNEAFIKAFDANLESLIADGSYANFLREKGLDPAAHMPTSN